MEETCQRENFNSQEFCRFLFCVCFFFLLTFWLVLWTAYSKFLVGPVSYRQSGTSTIVSSFACASDDRAKSNSSSCSKHHQHHASSRPPDLRHLRHPVDDDRGGRGGGTTVDAAARDDYQSRPNLYRVLSCVDATPGRIIQLE